MYYNEQLKNVDGVTSDYLWYAKTCSRPSWSVNVVEHKYLNHTFKFPGGLNWDPVSIELVDPAGEDDIMTALAEICMKSGYAMPATANDLTTLGKSNMMDALGPIIITMYDASETTKAAYATGEGATPRILEQWTLNQAFITKIEASQLDYSSEELATITLEVIYDWATLNVGNPDGLAGPYYDKDNNPIAANLPTTGT